MPRTLFNLLCDVSVSRSEYLRKGLRPDATGYLGISSLLKAVYSLRQLSYDILANLSDDRFDVSDTTSALYLEHFFSAGRLVVCIYGIKLWVLL